MVEEINQTGVFIGQRARLRVVSLAWPLDFGGQRFESVGIKRLTAREVSEWQERLKGLPDDSEVRFPLFCGADGGPLPEGLLDAIDDDDRLAIDKAALDFLPQRFRAIPNGGLEPSTGAVTAPSSAA